MDLSTYDLAAAYDAVPARAPREGERTGPQSGTAGGTLWGLPWWGGDATLNPPTLPRTRLAIGSAASAGAASGGGLFEYGDSPAPGYDLFRQMDRFHTLALARAVVMAPVLLAKWSFEGKKETPTDRVDFVRETFSPMRMFLLGQMGRGVSFGHRLFELVYEQRTFANRTLQTIRKFKPLRPEKTAIVADKRTGQFLGAKQGDVELPVEKCFLYSYDMEDDDYRGQSRHLNVIDPWWDWVNTAKSSGKLEQKISGIIPIVHYPPGKGQDASGKEVDNFQNALALVAGLARQRGIVLENLTAATFDPHLVGEAAGKSLWDVDFYDAGHTAAAQNGFTEKLRHLESLMMRGWLLPERTALEGQFGTKAEAGVHGDVGTANSDLLHQEMVQCLNWHAVDRLLAMNFGEEARGSVWIKAGPVVDEQKAFFRELFKQLLSNPRFTASMVAQLDVDAIVDKTDVPKLDGVGTLTLEPEEQKPDPANGDGRPGVNGNGAAARRMNFARGVELLGEIEGDDDGD